MEGKSRQRRVDPKSEAIFYIKQMSDKVDSLEGLYINAQKGGKSDILRKPLTEKSVSPKHGP